jgi:exosortase/archaeosortase family protein
MFLTVGYLFRYQYHNNLTVQNYVINSWFIDTFYRVLIGPTGFLLRVTGVPMEFGYFVSTVQYYIYLPETDYKIILYIPCLGISLTYIYISLIVAFPETVIKKIKYIIAGIVLIQILNILRLYGLCLLLSRDQSGQNYLFKITSNIVVSHESIFNWAVIILIFLIFIRFTKKLTISSKKSGNKIHATD